MLRNEILHKQFLIQLTSGRGKSKIISTKPHICKNLICSSDTGEDKKTHLLNKLFLSSQVRVLLVVVSQCIMTTESEIQPGIKFCSFFSMFLLSLSV